MADNEKIVAIFGTGNAGENDENFAFAQELGRLLAAEGIAITNGGYGGVMLAVSKGAASAGGKVIGVTCKAFGRSGANEFVTEEIVTGCLDERLKNLIDIADAYVIMPGGTGTLLELANVWELKNKGFLAKEKPIIIAGKFWQPLIDLIEGFEAGCSDHIDTADNPKDLLGLLKKALQ